MLSKLQSYGIHDSVIRWIRSFLCFRTQSVRVNGFMSGSKKVLSGVPQGSVLGPLLFTIFINDLPSVCNLFADIFLYADDSKLLKTISCALDCAALNSCFKSVHKWCDTWRMNLSIVKCKVLSICRCKDDIIHYDYGFNDPSSGLVKLDHVSDIKDLGVIVDNTLNFSLHIHEKLPWHLKCLE